jgi:soluble lytic murein transglycosylase-like protein
MATVTEKEVTATKIAQQLMAGHTGKTLIADGRWGSYTQSVYAALTAEVKAAVDQVLKSFGTDARRLFVSFQADSIANPGSKARFEAERASISANAQKMRELVVRVATQEGVPVQTALAICWLESKFNPSAVSPTGAKGLFQFTSIAVRDVRERAGYDLKGKEFDPESNAIAGMRYLKLVSRDMGVPLTDAPKLYMGFNIGPSAAKNYLAGNVTEVVAKAISQQAYGPPAVYGKNLTAKVESALRTA